MRICITYNLIKTISYITNDKDKYYEIKKVERERERERERGRGARLPLWLC